MTREKALEAIKCLRQDLDMLKDGSWEPDADSIDASREMLDKIESFLCPIGVDEKQELYINDPNHCPHCGSGNITTDGVEVYQDAGYANVSCEDCGATWTDEFRLVGFDNLEVPEEDEE